MVIIGAVLLYFIKSPTQLVTWKSYSLADFYPEGTATNDIVGDTLNALDQMYDWLHKEIKGDPNLFRLIGKEKVTAINRAELDSDLKKLKGLELAFIGQFHETINSEERVVLETQLYIAKKVRSEYEVMWSEDFTGGNVINADNAWRELEAESKESDLPAIQNLNRESEAVTKEYMIRATPMHASFQILFDSNSSVEVMGADYFRVKVIQQHFMEYEYPLHMRGSPAPVVEPLNKQKISHVLSDVRNLYIMRYIALNADRNKKNVLVLGSYHVSHITYIMQKYGVRCKVILLPFTKK